MVIQKYIMKSANRFTQFRNCFELYWNNVIRRTAENKNFQGISSLRGDERLHPAVKIPAPQVRRAQAGIVSPGDIRQADAGKRRTDLPPRERHFRSTNQITRRRINLRRLALLILIPIVIAAGVYLLYKSNFWVIRDLTVEVNQGSLTPESQQKLETIKAELLGKNLLTYNLTQVRDQLLVDPFIRKVTATKSYPGQVHLKLELLVPKYEFRGPNELLLVSAQGELVKIANLEDNFQLAQDDRLIYLERAPFKSDKLRQLWLEQEKSNLITKYKEASKDVNPGIETTDDQAILDSKEYQDFAGSEYANTPLNNLSNLYRQVRAEVSIVVDQRLAEIEKYRNVTIPDGLPVIHSLVNSQDIYWLKTGSAIQTLLDVESNLEAEQLKCTRITIVSPNTLYYTCTIKEDKSVRILLKYQDNYTIELTKLRAVLIELNNRNEQFQDIDLRGEKVVVS